MRRLPSTTSSGPATMKYALFTLACTACLLLGGCVVLRV